jgi:hypothetical protein
MGIQQTAAPLPQTRGLKRTDEVFELAGSRALPRAPERQRGLWSFLTWSFVIAPIVTAESFFAKNGHTLTPADDQNDPSTYHDKDQLAATSDQDPTVAAAAIASDGSQEDNTDASRLVGAVRWAAHNGDPQHDKSPTLAVARDTDPASAPTGGGGGGGGPSDTNATSDGTSKLQNVDNVDEGSPSGSSELTLSSAEISDVHNLTSSGGIPDDLSQSSGGGPYIELPAGGEPISVQIGSLGQGLLSGEIPNSLPHEIAVGASTDGGPIDTLVGSELGLAHITSDVISTITKAAPDILLPVGLDTVVASLKDVLGFDLHVNAAGGFVANDLSAALDSNPSQLVAAVVSTAAIPVAGGLPLVGVGASEELDSLLSGKGLLDVGHLSDAISETSSVVAAAASAVSPESSLSTNLLDSGASKSTDSLLGGKGLLDVGHLNDVTSETSSVVATVTSAVSPESALITNLLDSEASKSADSLLGGKGLLDVGHLNDVTSETSSVVATVTSAVSPESSLSTNLLVSEASESADSLLGGKGLLDVGHLSDAISETSSVVAAAASAVSPESSLSTNLLDSEASKSADSLLGDKGLLDVGHLSDPISEPSSVVATSGLSSDLGGDVSATLEKVSAPALSISHESGSNTNLSMVSTVSDAPHVGIVGEATDLTPGHSVDFPAQPVPEGDALFSGTSYTDYHVALNTGVSSNAVNGISDTTTTVTNSHDAASVSPVDSPNGSHASEPPAPEHHEASLTQVSNAVDELSVRGHSH